MVAEKIRRYMVERLGVGEAEVEERCRELYLNYGTTLAGLVVSSGWRFYGVAAAPPPRLNRRSPPTPASPFLPKCSPLLLLWGRTIVAGFWAHHRF